MQLPSVKGICISYNAEKKWNKSMEACIYMCNAYFLTSMCGIALVVSSDVVWWGLVPAKARKLWDARICVWAALSQLRKDKTTIDVSFPSHLRLWRCCAISTKLILFISVKCVFLQDSLLKGEILHSLHLLSRGFIFLYFTLQNEKHLNNSITGSTIKSPKEWLWNVFFPVCASLW